LRLITFAQFQSNFNELLGQRDDEILGPATGVNTGQGMRVQRPSGWLAAVPML